MEELLTCQQANTPRADEEKLKLKYEVFVYYMVVIKPWYCAVEVTPQLVITWPDIYGRRPEKD